MKNEPTSIAMKSEIVGTGDTAILVPGALTGWLSWEPHAKQLSENHRVVRVQLISVDLGLQNEPLPPNYSVDYETNALSQTIHQNEIAQAHFVAWSLGAEIALNFALNNPDRVRTLTLIEPTAIWVLRSRGPLPERVLEEREAFQSLGPAEINESQLERFTRSVGLVPPTVDPKSLPQWPVWVKHRRSLRIGDVAYRHEDSIQRVRNFGKSVLLFKGAGSSETLHQIVDVLGSEFPHAQVEMLPGGHASHLASLGEFMKILTSFMRS